MKCSIVIPTLNEEENIGETIKDYKKHFPQSEIIVVDGGSIDQTISIAKKAGADVYWFKTKNAAQALLFGFGVAKGDFIIMTDADGTYGAYWARKMFEKVEGQDLVIGERMNNRFLSHRLATWIIGLFVKALFGIRETDIASGLRVMSREFAQSSFQPDEGMWVDMVIKAKRWTDYPILYWPRERGVSKIKGKGHKVFWRYLKAITRNLFYE